MRSVLALEVSFDDDGARWTVGALSTWNGQIELARSHQCGPFTGIADVERWLLGMFHAWTTPALGDSPSESLHDSYADLAP